MPVERNYDFTMRDFVRVLFRQKWTIILTILTVSVSAGIGLKLRTPLYEADVKMLISSEKQVESPYYRELETGRNLEAAMTQSEIVKSAPVLQRAIAALNLHSRSNTYEKNFASPLKQRFIDWNNKRFNLESFPPDQQVVIRYRMAFEDLKSKITVEPIRDTNLFRIKARDYSPVGAAIIANVVSRAYVIFDLEQQLVELLTKYTEKNPVVRQIRENIGRLEQNLNGQPMSNIDALGPATVKIVEQAIPPVKPIGMPEKMTFVLAVIMSVVLGVFLAFVFEFADQSFRTKNDLESFLNTPVIACVNKKRGWTERRLVKDVLKDTHSPRATSYRILAQQLVYLSKTKKLKTILFGQIAQKEASLIVANLALMLSGRLGLKTLLIDSNLRRPHQHRIFNVALPAGLAEALEGKSDGGPFIKTAGKKNLSLITAGLTSIDAGVLLDTGAFQALLNDIKSSYDIILVDGADLRDYRDTALLGPAVDGVVLIVGEGSVRRQVVAHAVQPLRESSSNVLGAVMNNRDYVIPKFLYENV